MGGAKGMGVWLIAYAAYGGVAKVEWAGLNRWVWRGGVVKAVWAGIKAWGRGH